MWSKFDNPSISMRKDNNHNLNSKITFFEGRSWFKFNDSRLAQVMALTFSTSVGKVLKLTVTEVWRMIPTFVEVIGEKLVRMPFATPPAILNRTETLKL